jgi:hypothetical protein
VRLKDNDSAAPTLCGLADRVESESVSSYFSRRAVAAEAWRISNTVATVVAVCRGIAAVVYGSRAPSVY